MPSSRPKPDCLKPPNGVVGAHRAVRVDREDARLDRACDPQRARAVARPDRAREPVRRVVRDPDRIRLVVERDQRRNRPEDLLARDPVAVRASTSVHGNQKPLPVRRVAAEERLALDEGRRPSRGARRRSAGPSPSPRPSGRRPSRRALRRRAARRSGRRRERSTRMRERAQQSWPALSKTAYGAAAAARSRSASAKTTFADLPPSSSVTRLIVAAAPCITRAPPRSSR